MKTSTNPNRRYSYGSNEKTNKNQGETLTSSPTLGNSVNRKQFTVNYVYSLQFTPTLDDKCSHSKVVSFRVSPAQYDFLTSTPDIQTIFRRFVDSLRIEEMPLEDKAFVLLKQIETLEIEIAALTKNTRYLQAKELFSETSPWITRRATKEEHDRRFKEEAKKCGDFDGETSEELEKAEKEGRYNFWVVAENNSQHTRFATVIKATEQQLAKKQQILTDLRLELEAVNNSLR